MRVTYITKALDKWTTVIKTPQMKKARTEYECPLCHGTVKKRDFEEHAFKEHKSRSEEALSLLYGLPYPYRCSCGKDLHYSSLHKGFPTCCGNCSTGTVTEVDYKNSKEARTHIEQLEQLLKIARDKETQLKKEEELSKIPLDKLLFPSIKYKYFMKRLSSQIRVSVINGEKDKLIEIANLIDNKFKEEV